MPARESLDFLAVCDSFLNETAELADVVLPVTQWAEEDGTLTNLEGRVVRRRRVNAPPPGVRTGGLQRGFGSKPRTGQGYEEEFEES